MSPARAAAYLGAGVLLLAWLSSAAGIGEQPPVPTETAQPIQTAGTETLATEVQAQAGRLRDRLASAPSPGPAVRNPFAFAPRPEPPPARSRAAAPAPAPVVPQFPEPLLALIGVAESAAPAGPVRTAIITAEGGELFIVSAGESIGARYKVETIGADAVQLTDLVTGATRRLVLRQ